MNVSSGGVTPVASEDTERGGSTEAVIADVESVGSVAVGGEASMFDDGASIKSEELSGARSDVELSLSCGFDARLASAGFEDLTTLRMDGGLFGVTAFSVGGRAFGVFGAVVERDVALSSARGTSPTCCNGFSTSPINQGE